MYKKVKDKTFNWCEKCKRWTTRTHTTATHTGGNKNNNNISSAATVPTANLSTLAPDPSVWVLDFDTSPTTTTISLLCAFATFLYNSILSTLLHPAPITLLIASLFICIISSLTSKLDFDTSPTTTTISLLRAFATLSSSTIPFFPLYSSIHLSLFSLPPSSFASSLHFLLCSPSISPRPSHGPLYLTGLSTLFVKSTALIMQRSYSPLSYGSLFSRSRSGNLDTNSRSRLLCSRLVLLGSNIIVLQSCFDLT